MGATSSAYTIIAVGANVIPKQYLIKLSMLSPVMFPCLQ